MRTLVKLAEDPRRDCVQARDLAQAQLDAVRLKLAELQALERSLVGFVEGCTQACAGGPAPDCLIIEDIARAQPAAKPAAPCCRG